MTELLRKMWAVLSPEHRRAWLQLAPLAGLTAMMESLAAIFVVVLVAALAGDASAIPPGAATQAASRLLAAVAGTGPLAIALFMAAFFVLKNALQTFCVVRTHRVAQSGRAAVATKLFKGYLAAPYSYHLRHDSNELLQVLGEANDRVFRIAMPAAFSIAYEGTVIVGLVGAMFLVTPGRTVIAVAAIAGLCLAVMVVSRRRITRWGELSMARHRELLQLQRAAFGGIKETRVFGREAHFVSRGSRAEDEISRIDLHQATLEDLPRALIETIFVVGAVAMAGIAVASGQPGAGVFPVLGLLTYAGFRLIPAANRVLYRIGLLRFSAASINLVHDHYRTVVDEAAVPEPGSTMPEWRVLELADVSFRYDGAATPALRDVSFQIHRGETVAIVGRTGAGKSTLVDVILGLQQPQGSVTADGLDIFTNVSAWQAQIGYVPQHVYLFNDTLRNNVAFGQDAIDDARVHRALEIAQLADLVATLPDGLDSIIGERGAALSGGERQRLAVARALYVEPALLVFDEVAAGLDPATAASMDAAIRAAFPDTTLIAITHRIDTLHRSSRVITVADGRVTSEPADEVEAVLRDLSRD